MEEMVWVYFSVIGIILTLGIIMGLVMTNRADVGSAQVQSALQALQDQCNYVCDTGVGTNLPVEVTLPAGLFLYSHSAKICGTFGDDNSCRPCDCNLDNYTMDLNTTFAKETMKTHKFICHFKKNERSVSFDCQG